jgi:hypothetical protein
MARGKTGPCERLAIALTRFLEADRFRENISGSAPFLRARHPWDIAPRNRALRGRVFWAKPPKNSVLLGRVS